MPTILSAPRHTTLTVLGRVEALTRCGLLLHTE